MARFHALNVTDIKKTTRDAVVVTLCPDEPEAFDFIQGQYLTFRHSIDGQDLRRSYSICAGRDDGVLQVGIKRVEGGAFSTWANEVLAVGDRIDAMAPTGTFHTPLSAEAENHYLAFAVGSGITPILSILRTVLTREPRSTFTLVYGNRSATTIMFREELEDLKNQFLGRVNVIHILKQGAEEIELFSGRITAEKCAALFAHWIPVDTVATAFICGPEPMMEAVAGSLQDHGLRDDQIKFELFGTAQPARPGAAHAPRDAAQAEIEATVTLDGERRTFQMARGQTVLDAALASALDAPFACRAGVCSTCRARVTEGEVEMIQNHALEDGEIARGYVLTCQCLVLSDTVALTFDDH